MIPSFRGGRCHLSDQMFGDRLLALRADIGDTAENVQFRHVASGAPARNLVADSAIPVNGPRRTVYGETGDVDEAELIEPALLHIVFVHEQDCSQSLESPVAIVVRIDRGVELVVRAN